MSIENRRFPRLTTSVPVGLRFPSGNVQQGWGRIINVSATGLLLETRSALKVGGVIYTTFALKDGAKFENLRAHVIRVSYEEGYFVAGKFCNVSPD